MTEHEHDPRGMSGGEMPVDDRTYNLLQALTSTLEALDAYEMYSQEEGEGGVFDELIDDERRHADLLLDELRSSLSPGGTSSGPSGATSRQAGS